MPKKEEPPERIEEVSADLPYELQSRLFEQLATLSLGALGLTITLSGTILESDPLVWISTIEFGIAGLFALAGNQSLIANLFRRKATRKNNLVMTGLCMMFIGMGSGSLATAVFLNSTAG